MDPSLQAIVREQPYPLLFATVSGAHLYGFPSPDSDFDVRGAHVLPAGEVVGLMPLRDTIECSSVRDGREIDLVTHDARKFFELMLKKNGYVLEQLLSPLTVATTPEHEELKALAPGCMTRFHAYHYLGFSETQWHLFQKERPPRVKPLLYIYRVLYTGIHLMRTGEVEANLVRLNETFRNPDIPELIDRRLSGAEKSVLNDVDLAVHEREYARLRQELQEAMAVSRLPPEASARAPLSDLLVRLRLRSVRP